MSEVCVFLADGFEEIEALTVVDVLRRAGIRTEMISIMSKKKVVGSHGIVVKADEKFDKADYSDTEMLVLPGGSKGTENLKAHVRLRELILKFHKDANYLAAICAAPTILAGLGLLDGKRATCYPAMEDGMKGARLVREPAVADGSIITGRGMGTAIDFALKLVETLRDKETADQIAQQIVYQRG